MKVHKNGLTVEKSEYSIGCMISIQITHWATKETHVVENESDGLWCMLRIGYLVVLCWSDIIFKTKTKFDCLHSKVFLI